MKLLLPALLLLVLLVGCVSPNRKLVGQPSSALLAARGEPSERVPDGQGGEIWRYVERQQQWGTIEHEGNVITGAYNTSDKSTTWMLSRPHTPILVHCFYVNRDGTVYKYARREDYR